ncbi:MAG: DUF5615 family PIN-like protein [Dehalococcoidia bacterium]
MRFYLDEHYSTVLAEMCRRRGVDVRSTHEEGCDGATDEAQLLYAATERRAIVTENRSDFEYRTERFQAEGLPHAGVVLVPSSIASDQFEVIAGGIVYLNGLYPDGLPPYTVIWLMRAPEGYAPEALLG